MAANNIALFEKYVPLLDEVYAQSSKTAVLDGDAALVRAGANTHALQVPKMSMDGLGDYSRSSGYAPGTVSIAYEEVAFNYDRGRRFTVDVMDDEETAGIAFGKLSSEFVRTKVVREMDAFRFAQYAGTPNISTTSAAVLSTAKNWLDALITAKTAMDNDEVDEENRYLFITPAGKNLVDNLDSYVSRSVLDSFAGVITVPQGRFCTGIELLDGTTEDELAGGFTLTGNDINFLIVEKSAVMQYTKHTVDKIIAPAANQFTDGYLFFYRAYGLADVYENKAAGIYLHKSTVTHGGSN